MRLQGKTEIVTGSGFCAGIAGKFTAEGARVLVADINSDAAQVIPIEKFGHIDIIVNNAGVTHLPAPFDTISEDDFDRVFAVNCKSVYLITRARTPSRLKRPCSLFSWAKTRPNAASYLCSNEASMATRGCIEVDGSRCI